MSTWTIHKPRNPDERILISTDDPEFAGVDLNEVAPQFWIYELNDALKFVGYRMKVGDAILTEAVGEARDMQAERIRASLHQIDWDTVNYDELQEVFEDRDPAEFL